MSFYCLDNDIILKLATCNLFDNVLKIFELDTNQVKILDSFKYKFRNQIQRKRGNKEVRNFQHNIEKVLEMIENYSTISEHNLDTIVIDTYTKLLNYSKTKDKNTKNTIDQGEAILIAYLYYLNQQNDTNYLLTSDKSCLRALTNSGFNDVIEYINGKVWCFEQLILKNIEEFGFDLIQDKIYPVRDCDTNIKTIFGYTIKVPEDRVKEDLKKEIIRLKQETGNLLYPYPN
ncbi:hypothetical protein NIES4106_61010 (plasmid) [Fischerella sp. NIES-4106]|nr:hypothetical protein NIES4106_61010 [Fischerella sp. NIES-4106]